MQLMFSEIGWQMLGLTIGNPRSTIHNRREFERWTAHDTALGWDGETLRLFDENELGGQIWASEEAAAVGWGAASKPAQR